MAIDYKARRKEREKKLQERAIKKFASKDASERERRYYGKTLKETDSPEQRQAIEEAIEKSIPAWERKSTAEARAKEEQRLKEGRELMQIEKQAQESKSYIYSENRQTLITPSGINIRTENPQEYLREEQAKIQKKSEKESNAQYRKQLKESLEGEGYSWLAEQKLLISSKGEIWNIPSGNYEKFIEKRSMEQAKESGETSYFKEKGVLFHKGLGYSTLYPERTIEISGLTLKQKEELNFKISDLMKGESIELERKKTMQETITVKDNQIYKQSQIYGFHFPEKKTVAWIEEKKDVKFMLKKETESFYKKELDWYLYEKEQKGIRSKIFLPIEKTLRNVKLWYDKPSENKIKSYSAPYGEYGLFVVSGAVKFVKESLYLDKSFRKDESYRVPSNYLKIEGTGEEGLYKVGELKGQYLGFEGVNIAASKITNIILPKLAKIRFNFKGGMETSAVYGDDLLKASSGVMGEAKISLLGRTSKYDFLVSASTYSDDVDDLFKGVQKVIIKSDDYLYSFKGKSTGFSKYMDDITSYSKETGFLDEISRTRLKDFKIKGGKLSYNFESESVSKNIFEQILLSFDDYSFRAGKIKTMGKTDMYPRSFFRSKTTSRSITEMTFAERPFKFEFSDDIFVQRASKGKIAGLGKSMKTSDKKLIWDIRKDELSLSTIYKKNIKLTPEEYLNYLTGKGKIKVYKIYLPDETLGITWTNKYDKTAPKIIQLNKKLFSISPEKIKQKTIAHELAHYRQPLWLKKISKNIPYKFQPTEIDARTYSFVKSRTGFRISILDNADDVYKLQTAKGKGVNFIEKNQVFKSKKGTFATSIIDDVPDDIMTGTSGLKMKTQDVRGLIETPLRDIATEEIKKPIIVSGFLGRLQPETEKLQPEIKPVVVYEPMIKDRTKSMIRNIFDLEKDIKTNIKPIPILTPIIKTNAKSRSRTKSKLDKLNIVEEDIIERPIEKIIPINISTPGIIPIIPTTGFPKIRLPRFKKQEYFEGYEVEVKRFGEWKTIERDLTERGAIAVGMKDTLRSLGASFRIKPTGDIATRDIPYSKSLLEKAFRSYKIEGEKKIPLNNMFIQRKGGKEGGLIGGRLSSSFEIGEIQMFKKKRTKEKDFFGAFEDF